MQQEIGSRFRANIARVCRLVDASTFVDPRMQRRDAAISEDVLRAAVVFLHAAMEDLLRSVSRWKLPTADPAAFKDMSFPGGDAIKCSLVELVPRRGQTIDKLIDDAIEQLLEKSSYNNTNEVSAALVRVGVVPGPILDRFGAQIDAMTRRHHQIVHRADIRTYVGSGPSVAHPLKESTVKSWITEIEQFGPAVLNACQGSPP